MLYLFYKNRRLGKVKFSRITTLVGSRSGNSTNHTGADLAFLPLSCTQNHCQRETWNTLKPSPHLPKRSRKKVFLLLLLAKVIALRHYHSSPPSCLVTFRGRHYFCPERIRKIEEHLVWPTSLCMM